LCACADPVGECISGSCRSDADFAGGELCAYYSFDDGCGERRGFACTSAADECTVSADCSDTECGVLPGGATRSCIGYQCDIGRPFLVEGTARVAPAVCRDEWASTPGAMTSTLSEHARQQLAAEWTRLGLMEHASIAAFARFALQLLQLGAPPEFIQATTQALADETEHARLAFGLASRFAGASIGPGPLCLDHALGEQDLASIVRCTFIEGCIGETVAALEARIAGETTSDPSIQGVLLEITHDEQRHAELAWRFVQWALERSPGLLPSLGAVLQQQMREAQALSAAAATEGDFDASLAAHGILPERQRLELRCEALRSVVLPCLEQLRASVTARAVVAASRHSAAADAARPRNS
jgi:hypothetical protein